MCKSNSRVFFQGEITLYRVQIDGRGGDSIHYEYFETEKDAELASAIDGGYHNTRAVSVMKLSNGRHMEMPQYIDISPPPGRGAKKKLLGELPRAQKVWLARRH